MLKTTVLFATASATLPAIVQTDYVPSVMTWVMSSLTAHSWRTPARGSSSTRETQRAFDLVLEVQVFEGGNVTVQGTDLLFSIIHLPGLISDLLLTFTATVVFSTDTFHYTIW